MEILKIVDNNWEGRNYRKTSSCGLYNLQKPSLEFNIYKNLNKLKLIFNKEYKTYYEFYTVKYEQSQLNFLHAKFTPI